MTTLPAAPTFPPNTGARLPAEMEIDSAALVVVGTASMACTVKLHVPAADGAPEITPVDEPSERPVQSVPDMMLHVVGAVQFDVPIVWL